MSDGETAVTGRGETSLDVEVVARLRAAGCVFAEDEAALLLAAAETPDALDRLLDKRVRGLPLEHVLGWVEFCGVRVAVDPGVFVPRRRTELLVAEAVNRLAPGDIAVDLCCGSGAVAAALRARAPEIEVHAADIDPAAVACARRNLDGAPVYCGDLFEPLPPALMGRVAAIVANTPYVPTDAIASMPPEARVHEPRVALDGGTDGLDVQRRVAAAAPHWLEPGGHLLVETSEAQADHAVAVFTGAGLAARVVRADDLGAIAVIGTR